MSQHDFVISDQGMPAARSDLNAGLQALASCSKGPSAPTTPYTGQLWLDDDTPSATVWTLNCYDGTDWIALGQLDTTNNRFQATNHVRTDVKPAFTVAIDEAAWVDVASATTTDIGAAASNNVRITGTTTITSLGTSASGVTRRVRFAGALTLTHNATALILPGAANIATAADDCAVFTSLGAGNWICSDYKKASGTPVSGAGKLKQRVYATYTTYASTTVTIPHDNTIPQNTEGMETVSATITPASAANRLRVTCEFNYLGTGTNEFGAAALFRDSIADAKAVESANTAGGAGGAGMLVFEEAAGSTAATTYKLRMGPNAGTMYFNGDNLGARYGGVQAHRMIIEEIEP